MRGSSLRSLSFYTQVILIMPVASGDLIVSPQNLVAMSGERVEMQCQTNNNKKLKWFIQRPGYFKEDEEQIYSGFRFSSLAARFYAINTSSVGEFRLLFNASMVTAQRYKCLEPRSLESVSAELVVLESDPSCNTIRDDRYANVTCNIVFHGNWAPTMLWTQCNNETIVMTSDVSNLEYPKGRLSSTLTVGRYGNNSESCYRLTTMFREGDRPQGTTANNTPSYNHSICFKHPDWCNTSDCKEDLKDNRTTISSTENEESDIPLKVLSVIAGILALIAIFGVAFYCFKRYCRQSVSRNTTQPVLTLMEHPCQGHAKRATKAKQKFQGLLAIVKP